MRKVYLHRAPALSAHGRSAAVGFKRQCKEKRSRPVSRVLSLDSHSSRPCVAARLEQPTREQRGPRQCSPIWSCSEWGLPCHAALSPRAVRSYRTVSPLPRMPRGTVRRFALCCTFRRLTPPRRYLALCPVEPGLSSKCLRASRLSGRLRVYFTSIAPLPRTTVN